MNSKYVKLLAAPLGLLLIIFCLTNCSRFQDPDSSMELAPDADPQNPLRDPAAIKTVYYGDGATTAKDYESGCSPAIIDDFIERVSWNTRRIDPRDCTLVNIKTPVISWAFPTDIKLDSNMNPTAMKLVLRYRMDSTQQLTDVFNFPMLTTTSHILTPPLQPGEYLWHVEYRKNVNEEWVVGADRRFYISTQADFSIPQGKVIADIVAAKPHPRALPVGKSFADISSLALAGEYSQEYNSFINRADVLAAAPPAPLPAGSPPSGVTFDTWLRDLRFQSMAEAKAIEYLGYAFKFTTDANKKLSYKEAAKIRLLNFATWSPTGPTSEANQDQANREIFLALGFGLDLLGAELTPQERAPIIAAMKDRINQLRVKYSGFNKTPYQSHTFTATMYVAEALMYVAGMPDFPEAEPWLAEAWEIMITNTGSWLTSSDGGYANGNDYAWSTLTVLARLLAAVKLISGVNLTQWPQFGSFGDNLIAFSPPNSYLRGQFGDGVENDRQYFDYSWDALRLYSSVTNKSEYEWYWRFNPQNVLTGSAISPFHYLLLGTSPGPTAPATTPNLPNSYLFDDIGVVAMHTKTADPLRSSVFFRSSRFGSGVHNHADNNAFTFVSKGKELLISGGYYSPGYMSDHHTLVARATRYKNALTFDGGIGQAEPLTNPTTPGRPVDTFESRGKIVNYVDNEDWAVTTGDATLAYRGQNPSTKIWTPLLSAAIRTVAFHRTKGLVMIYDYATSEVPRGWELNFQSLNAPTVLNPEQTAIKIANGPATACISVFGPPGTINTTNSFAAPAVGLPNQYQSRYKVDVQSNRLVALTVIREDCDNNNIFVSQTVDSNSGAATINVGGSIIKFIGRTFEIQ